MNCVGEAGVVWQRYSSLAIGQCMQHSAKTNTVNLCKTPVGHGLLTDLYKEVAALQR